MENLTITKTGVTNETLDFDIRKMNTTIREVIKSRGINEPKIEIKVIIEFEKNEI